MNNMTFVTGKYNIPRSEDSTSCPLIPTKEGRNEGSAQEYQAGKVNEKCTINKQHKIKDEQGAEKYYVKSNIQINKA